MMLSVLVWLAMQGQVPHCGLNSETATIVDCSHDARTSGDGNFTAQGWFPSEGRKPLTIYINGKPVPPREHVIEIKTVRKVVSKPTGEFRNKCPKGTQLSPDLPDGVSANVTQEMLRCFRVTKELYVDGVRWGVVKGLD